MVVTFGRFSAYSLAGGTVSSSNSGSGGSSSNNNPPTVWDVSTAGAGLTLSNNNLTVSSSSGTDGVRADHPIVSGVYYWDVTLDSSSGTGSHLIGIALATHPNTQFVGQTADSYAFYPFNGQKFNNNTGEAYAAAAVPGDVIRATFDADNRTLSFAKNGTALGVAYSSIPAGEYYPALSHDHSASTHQTTSDFNPSGGAGNGGTSDPASISGLQLWLDGEDSSTFTLSGNDVDQWNDKSGNNNHAIASSFGNKPRRVGTALDYDLGDVLEIPGLSFNGNDPRTVFIKFQSHQTGTIMNIVSFGGFANNERFSLVLDTNNSFGVVAEFNDTGFHGSLTTITQYIVAVVHDGTTLKIYLDNVEIHSSARNYNTDNSVARAFIGRNVEGATNAESFNGVLNSVVVYDSALSNSDREFVYNFLLAQS